MYLKGPYVTIFYVPVKRILVGIEGRKISMFQKKIKYIGKSGIKSKYSFNWRNLT
jgi:hypothetical protein